VTISPKNISLKREKSNEQYLTTHIRLRS